MHIEGEKQVTRVGSRLSVVYLSIVEDGNHNKDKNPPWKQHCLDFCRFLAIAS